jgi:hypothetical protein
VPKPNYGFQKRQKELAKKQKREAKAQRKQERTAEEMELGQEPENDRPAEGSEPPTPGSSSHHLE